MNLKKIHQTTVSKDMAKKFIIVGMMILILSGFIGIKITRQFHDRRPLNREQNDLSAIRSWMTLDYVSKEYRIPKSEFERSLGLDIGKYHKMSIAQMSKTIGINEDDFIQKIKNSIVDFQANHSVDFSPK